MFTLMSIGDWFAQNWMLLLILVLAVAMIVPPYLKQKKEVNARNDLNNQIVKGAKVITTAGVYGVVESIENTTDGKVVTIKTGSDKVGKTIYAEDIFAVAPGEKITVEGKAQLMRIIAK